MRTTDGKQEHIERGTAAELALFQILRDRPPMFAAIVQVLQTEGRDLSSRTIASKAGYRFNSRLRTALSELQTLGVIEQTAIGYRLSLSGVTGNG